jgi:uncharacterized protein YaeQ
MASKSTIFRATLQIADMDRHYYQDHTLTIARHPSETDERMMVRLLAYGLHADSALEFGQGMSNDEEADLWKKDLTGAIDFWIDVGMPDERLIRKACGRSRQVYIYCYGGRAVDLWYEQNREHFDRQRNLTIINLPREATQAMALLAQRNMNLQCLIQDAQITLSDAATSVTIAAHILYQPVLAG